MYKKISTLLFTLFVTSQIANAQIQIGGGFIYGTEIEDFGVQINGTLSIPGPIRLAADVGVYFVEDIEVNFLGNMATVETNLWELNVNGHYLIPGIPKANVYGLAGINITTASANSSGLNFDESQSEVGLNIGAGGEVPIVGLKLFGELKHIIGEIDQSVFSIGLRFGIGK